MSSTLAGFLRSLSRYLMHLVEVLRVQDLLVERRVQPELRVQLEPADPREVVLLRVEEHVLEERPRAVERRRIARPQAAVDLDERLFVRVDRILLQRLADDRPDLVALGEEDSMRSTFFSCAIEMTRGVSSSLASRITSPVDGSTTSAAAKAPSSSASAISTASTLALLQRLDGVLGDLLARLHGEVLAGDDDVLRRAQADEAVGHAPVERAVLQVQLVDAVEGSG